MKLNNLNLQDEINELINLYKNRDFEKGVNTSKELIKKYPKSPDIFFVRMFFMEKTYFFDGYVLFVLFEIVYKERDA